LAEGDHAVLLFLGIGAMKADAPAAEGRLRQADLGELPGVGEEGGDLSVRGKEITRVMTATEWPAQLDNLVSA
jgi:hypothetical protein